MSQHRLESFFNESKCNGMMIFMEFMFCVNAKMFYWVGEELKLKVQGLVATFQLGKHIDTLL